MRVLIGGASGFVGSALVRSLRQSGHDVIRLVRRAAVDRSEISWDPKEGHLDPARLDGIDAVVHLGGASIAGGYWTARRKHLIVDSRVRPTRLLAECLAGLDAPPRVFVCASAMGFYGDRGAEQLTEESPPGQGFLSAACVEWERAAEEAIDAGIRTVHLRISLVLGPGGGVLKPMLLPFRLGLGGRLGDGAQYMSWISLHDAITAVRFALDRQDLSGAINLCAPAAVTNAEFTRTLARVLRRPALFPAPAIVLRSLLGEMADALLLSSTRMVPRRLMNAGFSFRHPQLEAALLAAVGGEAP